ncbi:DoxX family protein [Natrinema salaciae]|uniref:Thiosulfate dehydrogenase [quinone] large subunit n=1 Tax=Natrinema salaciae TaxID=1186196 RepID=A0A1H9MH22_9EURY|nr:DoxX family protein [Natrinema salaciae]SER22831.1 thiosulfate dehydrogenase [quinone] large subunit [Natrinema salaciae]
MSTTEATVQWPGRRNEFEHAGPAASYVLVAARLLVGYWFLSSGWGKFAFVAGEPFDAAGYLQNAQSPIAGRFEVVAGTPWLLEVTNVMIPLGEFLIGLGLILGALVRLAAFFGRVLMTLFYLGNADWAHGYVNGDLLGLLLFVIVGVFAAGRILGVDASLERTAFVQRRPRLRYLLG